MQASKCTYTQLSKKSQCATQASLLVLEVFWGLCSADEFFYWKIIKETQFLQKHLFV